MHGTVVHRKLRFGPFELSIGERVLRRDGRVLSLGDRALDILSYLAERPGEVIAKQELMEHVWPDVTVEEGSLRVHVAAIRKALGDGQFGNRYIANVRGRGYAFVGTVAPLDDGKDSGSNSSDFRATPAAPPLTLIGREATESELRNWIRQVRFITLLGPGGIDNTTVAVATGHDADLRLIAALVQALQARQTSRRVGKAAGRERVRRRATNGAKTFDSNNGGRRRRCAFAHPRDCATPSDRIRYFTNWFSISFISGLLRPTARNSAKSSMITASQVLLPVTFLSPR
jgi:DNA-binding winged helix-turn-helix (wHTH) protein